MKKVFLSLILSLSLLLPVQASSVSDMLHRVMKSVAYLKHDKDGACTTFLVGIPDRWAAANHCVGKDMKINGEDVTVIKVSEELDLAMLRGPEGTMLPIAKKAPELGDRVYLVGWPAGWEGERPMVFFGNVATDPYHDDQLGHVLYGLDAGGGRGMSGGPIVNEKGDVVGMVEALMGGVPTVNSQTMWTQQWKDIQKFYK